MKLSSITTLALVLAACSQPVETAQAPASPTPPTATPAPPPLAAPVSLAGVYRIAGVDGADIDQPHAITASISADRIHVTADCLNFAWSYTARAAGIATQRVAVEGCARGLTAAEESVVAAFDAATTAVRTPANAIELRGGGRSVTLFSQ